jgi:hypothetical protein
MAWQPSCARGQSSGAGVSAAALTGPRAAVQTGAQFRLLVRELGLDATAAGHSASPAASSASEGGLVPLPGLTAAAVTAPGAAGR